MKRRMVLQLFVMLILIVDLTAIIIYFKMYIFSPYLILMVMSLYKFKCLFYEYLDYNSTSKFVVYRESFILFSIYIFKDGNKKYIDDGYYFCKNHDNNNLKLDYTVQGEEINVVLKKSVFKIVYLLAFMLVFIKTVAMYINISQIEDGSIELLLLTGFTLLNFPMIIGIMENKNKIKITKSECRYLEYSTIVDINWNWLSLCSCKLTYRKDYYERKLLDSKNYWFLYFVKSQLERIGNDGF